MTLSLSKITWSFLAVGFLTPCLLQGLFYFKLVPIERVPDWLFIVLWPGFGFYMASDTGNGVDTGHAILGFFLSVAANTLIYMLLGGLVSFFYRQAVHGKG